jgi:hypothetical protein
MKDLKKNSPHNQFDLEDIFHLPSKEVEEKGRKTIAPAVPILPLGS